MLFTIRAIGLILIFVAGLTVSGAFMPGDEPDFQKQGRIMLLQKLFALDPAKVYKADQSYLASIDAGFDADNQQYFVERHNENARFPDSGYLFILNYARPGSVTLTAFAPEEKPYQWLRCRLRHANGRIFARIVFQPDGECSDLTVLRAGNPDSLPRIALLSGE